MLKPLYLLLARRRLANITVPYSYGLSSMLPLYASSLFLCRQARGFLASNSPKPPHKPPPPPHTLSGMRRALLFFLVGAGLLVLTACGGGGGGNGSGGSGGSDNPPGDPGTGGNGGNGSPNALEVDLTFAPIEGGFRIGNQSDFGDMVSLSITATSEGEPAVAKPAIDITEFTDDSYDFTGLDDQSVWKFEITGTLSGERQQKVDINFVWMVNEEDHASGGIRAGINRDGDGRANSVDEDDDNDGVGDSSDDCSIGETGWMSNPSTDNDGDGCRDDRDEDPDDDNDNILDSMDTGMVGQRECRLYVDCDNDGLSDDDARERQSVGGMNCWELVDCDGDGVNDDVEAAGCVIKTNCDNDGARDSADIDDDGDGLIEIWTAAQLNSVRYVLNGEGRRTSPGGTLINNGCGGANGITECNGYELVTDISLATFANADNGKGWQPLAHDTESSELRCQGDAFVGTFDGNGWTISDLRISRSGQDCVGLFGNLAADSEIRNLRLHAETVIGKGFVGGLVGRGTSARIFSSLVVADEVRGRTNVGGLIGDGGEARIYSSSVVVGEVSGTGNIGGLAGNGQGTQIYSSSVVVGEVSGGTGNDVGGLVGTGFFTRVHSSSVVVGEVSGSTSVGGLAGIFSAGKLAYSYVVSGSDTAMLVGGGMGTEVASYWDSDTSGVTSGVFGDPQTTRDLRSPTDYNGIYATWDDDMDVFGDEDEPLAVWCDRDNNGNITADEQTLGNRVWDFGTDMEYPAIRCTPLAPAEWRSWWSLEGTPAKPQLNQTRLDALFP